MFDRKKAIKQKNKIQQNAVDGLKSHQHLMLT